MMSADSSQQQESSPDIRGTGWQPPDGDDGLNDGDRSTKVPSQGPGARAGAGGILGVARGVRERTDQRAIGQSQASEHVWTFRVERHDTEGRVLQPIPVEMRGLSFRGSINEGDWVEIPGTWKPGVTLQPRRLRNRTTGADVRSKGSAAAQNGVSLIIFVVFGVLVVFGFLQFAIHMPVLAP